MYLEIIIIVFSKHIIQCVMVSGWSLHRLLEVEELPCRLVPDSPGIHELEVIPWADFALHAAAQAFAGAGPS
jgi:hypothetical protein